jgi:geranylgeranyl diphosphate synthase type II
MSIFIGLRCAERILSDHQPQANQFSETVLTFDLESYLTARRQSIELALDRWLPSTEARPAQLHESIRYSVLAPGKRLRPTLVLAGAEAVGGSAGDVMLTACALECIHAFSLIHDDLPCMDNDDYRRGRLTNHKVYGDALALLAGDALLALAFQLVAENVATAPADRVLPTLRLIAEASGTWGMVGGQVVDMESQGREVTPDTLHYIHAHKTGALLTVSVLAGAMLAGATPEQIDPLRKYGSHIGLAFQIADDILDVTGDEARIGKPVGSDEERDKATYPRLYGLQESRSRAHAEVEAAVDALEPFDDRAEALRAIARYIVERDL